MRDKENSKKWRRVYCAVNPEKRLLWAAASRAKQRGLPWDITEEDIVIPEICPYLKVPLITHAPLGTNRSFVCSLDRIIPELGYVKGNIEVISQLANTMKQAATKEQLIQFAETVLEKFKC